MRKSRGCRFKSDHTLADVEELIGSNVDSIPLMYPLSYTYYSVYRTLILLYVITKDSMGISWISSGLVTFENLVTNNRSVFVSKFSLKFRGCSNTQNTPPKLRP